MSPSDFQDAFWTMTDDEAQEAAEYEANGFTFESMQSGPITYKLETNKQRATYRDYLATGHVPLTSLIMAVRG